MSLSATVALACLFSPKVYIILLHPEKNMRLTKQLKIHSNNLQFASQIAKAPNLPFSHGLLTYDVSSSDTQSKSLAGNNNEGNCQPLVEKLTVAFQPISNNHKAGYGVTDKKAKSKPNVATFVQTTHSKNCLGNEVRMLKMKNDSHDDYDSLDSNFIQNEEVEL